MLIHQRSTRTKKLTILGDYVAYLQEFDYDIGTLSLFTKVSRILWYNAIKDEIDPMTSNLVWNLVELSNGTWPLAINGFSKPKRLIKRHWTRQGKIIAKGSAQKGGIDHQEKFSSVFKKDSFRIIMTLVAHFDFTANGCENSLL